ncbi:PVC-type heme-binding CxxCH protein [Runella sp.]|uniref:PVC-type heme-binding CxxCH protein n=1 Tax=Runella sp. TaxID=1960881 RepID=UPI003D0E8778
MPNAPFKIIVLLSLATVLSFTGTNTIQNEYRAETEADSNQVYVPDDLEATLWAEAPLFYNPTNMDIDAKGRVWITEAVNYRNFNNKPDQKLSFTEGDRVMILEDTDGDGKADKSKIFVQDKDLVAPLGIGVIGNKVIVSCAPNIIVYTDENGDDIPDKKEILLTGFGGLDHDHSLHSLTAGPDGRWHFNTGNAGPHNVKDKSGWALRSGSIYTGGTPYNKENKANQKSDDGRVWVGGLALRMNADGTGLKVMAHNFRNSYEIAIDSYGNYWQNDNDDQVVTCRTSWVMEGSNAGYFSADGSRFWQADRRPDQDMFTVHWHQEDPGVLPAGENTGAGSPTGMLVYEGDALGEKYRGTVLSCEAGRNVVWAYWPQPKGAGYDFSKRIDLISSFPKVEAHYIWNETGQDKRKWFRPSDAATGPDGAIYVADWYDPVVGGHQMHDKKGYGRIYRITPKGKKLTTPKIDLSTTEGQIAALRNPAINVRNLGFVALQAKGESAVPVVKGLLNDPNPYVQARAIWLLAQLGGQGKAEVLKVLNENKDENLRIAAFRALKADYKSAKANVGIANPDGQSGVTAPFPSEGKGLGIGVLREIAISLRDLPYDQCKDQFKELVAAFDGQDRYYLEALGIGLDGKEEAFYKEVRNSWPKDPTTWSPKQAWLTWRLHPKSAVTDLQLRANAKTLSADERKRAITALGFIKDKAAALSMLELTKSPLKDVSEQAFYWVNFRKTNDWQDLLDWKEATVAQLSPGQKKMLEWQKVMMDTTIATPERENAAKILAADLYGGQLLLASASEYKIPKVVRATIAEHIFNNPDRSVRMMAGDYFPRPSGKGLSVSLAAAMPFNTENGKKIFQTNCTSCHRFEKDGKDIGPDLTSIGKKFDKNGLLDAIINPSASLAFGYEPWIIQTKDKNTYYGFLVGDGATVMLKDAAGKTTSIKASTIASRQQLKNSLMPEPSSLGLKEKDLSDLAGYLLKLPSQK